MKEALILRQEEPEDYIEVFELVKMAFHRLAISNQTEHLIIDRLRRSDAFVPELSIVAELHDQLVGHILLSKVKIRNNSTVHTVLSLAPVSVIPKHQQQGIGGALINHAHDIAKQMGFGACVLIGHSTYYPRFGYVQARDYNITFPFEVKEENGMVKELHADRLHDISGCVKYPKEFFE